MNKMKKNGWSAPMLISILLVAAVLVSGIVLLTLGIRNTVRRARVSAGYEATEGKLVDYGVYNVSHRKGRESVTYYLIYEYEAAGKTYTVKTDYGTGTVPPLNSEREIRYDPSAPENAVVGGSDGASFMLLIGAFFTLGGLLFVVIALEVKGVFARLRVNVPGAYMGFVFMAVGAGFILFRWGETGSLVTALTSMGAWMAVPVLVTLAGGALMIRSLLGR